MWGLPGVLLATSMVICLKLDYRTAAGVGVVCAGGRALSASMAQATASAPGFGKASSCIARHALIRPRCTSMAATHRTIGLSATCTHRTELSTRAWSPKLPRRCTCWPSPCTPALIHVRYRTDHLPLRPYIEHLPRKTPRHWRPWEQGCLGRDDAWGMDAPFCEDCNATCAREKPRRREALSRIFCTARLRAMAGR